ncbi:MAG: T9SS type A sorting domain-containing protein, partial [Candidatus Neomarinimicrobiota bacterium]
VNDLGGTPAELYPNYETIVEVQGLYTYICGDEPADWLDEGDKNLVISGDEWLNNCYDGWVATDYEAGDFLYDYMGVDQTYPDMNGAATGVSRLIAVDDDEISGDLAAFVADSLLLNYDPNYEIGMQNWLDGVDVTDDATLSYWGVSGLIDTLTFAASDTADTVASGVYMELANGSKTALFAFDALSLNTMAVDADALHGAGYNWIGVYPEGPIPQALEWMDALFFASTDDDVAQIPSRFALRQNYPNPFNPVTSISFDLPTDGDISLTVYNMLGQKVATLVNEVRTAGSHTVTWDGTTDAGIALATGVYLYRIDAGDFGATKKMILLK